MSRWLAVLVVAVAGCGTSAREPDRPQLIPGLVAHRGASFDAPENTLAAFARAWALGAASCETDVRLTRDGHAVLVHDETLARTAGLDRAVADVTLDELRSLDAGAWKDARFAGERVPTLEQALDALPAGRMLFIELKVGAAGAPAVADAILAADPRPRGGQLALQAYDADALAEAARRLPDVPTYWDVDPPYAPAMIDEALARGFTGLALDHRAVDDALVAAIAAAGLELDVWTVNDAAAIAAWRTRARWVETDRPDLARAQGDGAGAATSTDTGR